MSEVNVRSDGEDLPLKPYLILMKIGSSLSTRLAYHVFYQINLGVVVSPL